MAGIDNPAQACVAAMAAAVQSIGQMQGKAVLQVYDADDLIDNKVGVTLPAAGVLYEGIRSIERVLRETHRTGMDAEIVVSIVLIVDTEGVGPTKNKLKATTLLDACRKAVRDTRSPTGHFWRFVAELPAARKDGKILWVQRWSAPVHA